MSETTNKKPTSHLPASLAELPTDQWVENGGGHLFINSSTGAYALVGADDEPTGHWFIDVTFPDGRMVDNCLDSLSWAKDDAEETTWRTS